MQGEGEVLRLGLPQGNHVLFRSQCLTQMSAAGKVGCSLSADRLPRNFMRGVRGPAARSARVSCMT